MTRATSTTNDPPPLLTEHFEDLADRLGGAKGLLFCTDFDGTLAPITQDPDAPEPTPKNRERLAALADCPNVRVAAISGRALADLRGRLGISGIDYAGNHGLELLCAERDHATELVADSTGDAGHIVVHPVAAKRRRTLEAISDTLKNRLASVEGCVVENKGFSATVHYRRSPPEAIEGIRETVREVVEGIAPDRFERSPGKDIVEIDPSIAWDKGQAVGLLAEDHPSNWLTIYVGDDTTDETAFRAIAPEGIGIHVGENPETAARYRLTDPEGVEELLGWLLDEGLAALERQPDRPDS